MIETKINFEMRTLISYNDKKNKAIIPSGVKIIGKNAFSFNMNVNKIVIPPTVIEIQEDAFLCAFFLKTVVYNGTIEQWKNIKFNGYFSNPLCYANSISFINQSRVIHRYSNSLFGKLEMEKTHLDKFTEFTIWNQIQERFALYTKVATVNGNFLGYLNKGTKFKPILDKYALSHTACFLNSSLRLAENSIIYMLKKEAVNGFLETLKYHDLIKNNLDGEVDFSWVDHRINRHSRLIVEKGEVTLSFVSPSSSIEKIDQKDDLKQHIPQVVSIEQIAKICKLFKLDKIPNVKIEQWLHIPCWSFGYALEKYNLTEKEKKQHCKITVEDYNEYYENYKDAVIKLL